MDEINELINKLLTEKTFSLEAVEVINNLKKTAEELTKKLKTITDDNETLMRIQNNHRDTISVLKKGNEELTKLVEEHNKLTEKYKESIICADYAVKGIDELFRLTETIFKNDRIRTRVNGYKGGQSVDYTSEQAINQE